MASDIHTIRFLMVQEPALLDTSFSFFVGGLVRPLSEVMILIFDSINVLQDEWNNRNNERCHDSQFGLGFTFWRVDLAGGVSGVIK